MSNKNAKNSLQAIEIPAREESSKSLVLLHGYGANAQDLAPLIPLLQNGKDCWGYAPNAPETPKELAAYGGRAWFNLDMQMLQARAANPGGPLFDETHIKRLQSCVDNTLLPWLDSIHKENGELLLGGFSQGSMLCLDLLLRHNPEYISAVILFSGAWLYLDDGPKVTNKNLAPIYVSHGVNDPVLNIKHSRRMVDELRKRQFPVESNEFSGGHEIPPHIVEQAMKFSSLSFFHG